MYWGNILTWEQYYYRSHPSATDDECYQALKDDIDKLYWIYDNNDNEGLKLKSLRDKLKKVSALCAD